VVKLPRAATPTERGLGASPISGNAFKLGGLVRCAGELRYHILGGAAGVAYSAPRAVHVCRTVSGTIFAPLRENRGDDCN
jgi:hypothetical protein